MTPFGEWGLSILDDDLFEDGDDEPLFFSLRRRECVDCDELECRYCLEDDYDDCDDDDWCRVLESVQGGNQAALTHLFVEYLSNAQAAQLGDLLLSTSAFATVEHLHLVVGGLIVESTASSETATLHQTHAAVLQLSPPPPPFASLLAYCSNAQSGLRSIKLSAGPSPFLSLLSDDDDDDDDDLPPLTTSSPSPIEVVPVIDLFLQSLQQHSQLTELSLEHVTLTKSALASYLCSPHTRLHTLQVHLCDIYNDTNNDDDWATIAEDTNSARVQRLECTIASDEYDDHGTTILDVLLPLFGPAAVGLCSLQVTMSGAAQGSSSRRRRGDNRRSSNASRATPTRLALRAVQTHLLQCKTLQSLELIRFEDDKQGNDGILSELACTGSGAPLLLQHLVLDSCRLDDQSTRHLRDALSSSLSRLESLTLTGRTTLKNPLLLADIVQTVTQSSPATSALRRLSFDSHHGLDVDYNALFRALTQSSSGNKLPLPLQQEQSLQRLDLGLFSSRTAAFDALIRRLPCMTLLRELSLDWRLTGPMNEHHVDELVTAMRRNRSLLKIAYQYPDKWGSGRQASATLAIQQTGARNDLLHHWRTIAAGTHQETNHAPCASVPKSTENESNAAAAAGAADPKTAICDSARASINDSWWPHLVAAVEEQLGEDGRHDVVYDIVRVMTFQGIFSM